MKQPKIPSPKEPVYTISGYPLFVHKEVRELYRHGLDTDPEVLRAILQLPRKTLVNDLETVLCDGIRRFEHFAYKEGSEENHDFVLLSAYLLAELQAEESLDTLIVFSSMPKEVTDFYLSDAGCLDLFWITIYRCGQNQLQLLKECIKIPHFSSQGRIIVSAAVQQVSLHQPERREELLVWYRDVLEFVIGMHDKAELQDPETLEFILLQVMQCGFIELKEEVAFIIQNAMKEEDTTLVRDEYIHFTDSDIPHEPHVFKRPLRNLEENIRFAKKMKTAEGQNIALKEEYQRILKDIAEKEEKIEILKKYNEYLRETNRTSSEKPVTFQRSAPKLRRNDPCPCGSGKKYKKCCWR